MSYHHITKTRIHLDTLFPTRFQTRGKIPKSHLLPLVHLEQGTTLNLRTSTLAHMPPLTSPMSLDSGGVCDEQLGATLF